MSVHPNVRFKQEFIKVGHNGSLAGMHQLIAWWVLLSLIPDNRYSSWRHARSAPVPNSTWKRRKHRGLEVGLQRIINVSHELFLCSLLLCLLTPFWEPNSSSASQEILHLSWSLKVHYSVHMRPPLILILSQMNAVHTPPPYLFNIHLKIILWHSCFRQIN
jgi:hypothetical protein